ncbi:hypothetical protein OJ996_08590 [Luteolibacter sp. GHJ8]|uniref:Uncharacterized protein n=1 Tax=Luteolibacter rhizosphaerae TaxID=2989719 RepID=A0ABT3G1B5_9BACT|nr:hypothetical protein [Luteolibacter rhizosphaerae]MCW1913630.1 hypothetical protein [Luteolibacter rhizosphaerae]
MDLEKKIHGLKREIEESGDPSVAFKEIADILEGTTDPIGRYSIEKRLVEALTPGKDPVGEFHWLKDHETDILAHFKYAPGGMNGRLYDEICSSAAMNIHAHRKGQEFLAILQGLSDQEISGGLSLPVLSRWVAYGNEFDKLDAIDSPDLKSSILGGALRVMEKLRSPNTPEGVTAMIETYLSPQYKDFKDPGNGIIDDYVSQQWYETEAENVERLLESPGNRSAVDRLSAALAYRSGIAGDGRVDSYLDRIKDETLRSETIRKIESERIKR